jgi:hypothetical protein
MSSRRIFKRISRLDISSSIYRRSTGQRDRAKLPTSSIIREETRADRDQSPAKRQRTEFETNLEEDRDGGPLDIAGDWEDDHGSVLVGQSSSKRYRMT